MRDPEVDPGLGDSLLDAAVVDVVKVIQDLPGERMFGIEDDQLVWVEVLLVHSGGGVHKVVTLVDDNFVFFNISLVFVIIEHNQKFLTILINSTGFGGFIFLNSRITLKTLAETRSNLSQELYLSGSIILVTSGYLTFSLGLVSVL